ncbi:MAG: S8 family serine peptidase [Firmicutes bacterium]|nr:S8 family serine peptidase [Bacillota bacterium]
MVRRLVAILVVAMMVAALGVPALAATAVGQARGAQFIGDRDGNRVADDLDASLADIEAHATLPVIVRVSGPVGERLPQLRGLGGNFATKAEWDAALHGFAADLTRAQIEALARSPLVERIDLDREVSTCLSTATLWAGAKQARLDWGVDGDRDGSPTTYSNNDVVICILDTGIDAAHVDLDGGKVIGWKDYVNNKTAPYDDNGHGTHCASIAAGTGEGNSAYVGVAPGAALVGVKVLNRRGSGTTTTIINGVNWMISNKATYNIRIGSMSLGSSGSSDGTDSLSVAVNNAVNNGIIMCVAAGNSGPAQYTIGSPAAAANAITVGALVDPGEKGWAMAYFSSRGPTADGRVKPDICTPGYYITAAKANSTNQYVTMSGTSMATPFMAGVVALMLDANYNLTDGDVKSIAFANVKDGGPTGKDNDFGYGICKAYDCVKQAGGYTGTWADGLSWTGYTTGSLSGTGAYADHYISVTDTSKPLAITLVINNWTSSLDFNLYLYDPSGVQVAKSETNTRQETILYLPTVTGEYRVRVSSKAGSGTYWFASSWR